jgi:hypothetical protein
MSDINTFVITGTVESITEKNGGYYLLKVNSTRKTSQNETVHCLEFNAYKEKISGINQGDHVAIQGYLSAKSCVGKNGNFIAKTNEALTVKKFCGTKDSIEIDEPYDHRVMDADDNMPF